MRWPWESRSRPAEEPAGETARPATVSPAGWASLPPLRVQVTTITPTADLASFPGRRSTWSNPALTGAVQRQVAVGMPVLTRLTESPANASRASEASDLPVVARAAASSSARVASHATTQPATASPTGLTAGERHGTHQLPPAARSLTTSPTEHLPVLNLPTAPLADAVADSPDDAPDDGPGEPPALVPLQTVSASSPPAALAGREAGTRGPRPGAGAVTDPPTALPLAMQRAAEAEPGPAATEVSIPSTVVAPPTHSGARPGANPEPADGTAAAHRSEGTAVQRMATPAVPGPARPRAGLGAPLAPTPSASPAPPALPLVQRSATSTTTAGPAESARTARYLLAPSGPVPLAVPGVGAPPLAPNVPAASESPPADDLPEAAAADASDTVAATPAPADVEPTPVVRAPVMRAPVEPEPVVPDPVESAAPAQPRPLPLTLSRSVAEPAHAIPDVVLTEAVPTHRTPPPTDPGTDGPSPDESTPTAFESDRATGATQDREPGPASLDAQPNPPVPASQGTLPLVARDAARRADVVVSRSIDPGPPPRPEEPADRLASAPRGIDHVAGTVVTKGSTHQHPLVLATVQRATGTAVRPEPPPTLQRLHGLSTMPVLVRDRPAGPTGTPGTAEAATRLPTDRLGALASARSQAAALPSAPDAPELPVVSSDTAPEPATLPMPVATARALVAAVSGASSTGNGTPTLPDGIPAESRTAQVPATAAPADPETAATGPPVPSAGSATTVTAATGDTAATTAAATPQQLDELARRLFDPLASRLRAELLLDRERRGLRTDTW